MALKQCPECSKDVSSRAESCPHCGCPTGDGKDGKSPEFVAWCNRQRLIGIAGGVFGIILGIALGTVWHPVAYILAAAGAVIVPVHYFVWTVRKKR
jgi:hypothetical protein